MNQEQFNKSIQAIKNYVDSTIRKYTGGKKQVYLTQAEYNALSDIDKKDEIKVYNIIDATDTTANSLILTSPNGSKFTITVSDDGQLSATPYGTTEPEQPTLSSLTATYTQGDTVVYTDTSLDTLKTNLVVTANYSDGSNTNVTDYALSGNLTVGTSVITVTYEGKTTTFNVTVSSKNTQPETPSSYTNYIYNSDTFVNPTSGNAATKSTYYYAPDVNLSVSDGIATMTNKIEGTNGSLTIRHGFADNNVYYVQYKVKSDTAFSAGSTQNHINCPNGCSDWTTVSYVYTDSSAYQYLCDIVFNNGAIDQQPIYLKEPMKINLTEIYGSGNEPSKEDCDTIFTTYVSGIVG